MESTENKCSVVKIESVQNKNLVIETLADYRAKDKVKTSTYYLNLANGSKENQDISYVSIDNVSQENTQFDNGPIEDSTTEYVAVEVQDSGQIILHEKNVILWDELCRICANGCDQFIPIFTGEGFENNLSQKIHEYLPIQISENDDLPHQLCYNCASTLIAYDDIYKGCISAQERLNSLQSKLNKQELVNNSIAEDDDHFEQVLEDKTEEIDVNKDKLEENGDALDENYEEGDRYYKFPDGEVIAVLAPTTSHSTAKGHSKIAKKSQSKLSSVDPNIKEARRKELAKVKVKFDGLTYYQCPDCPKILSTSYNYFTHKRIHTHEKPCTCEICGKSFTASSSLTRHIREVHEKIKEFGCKFCDRMLASKIARDEHERTHTDERPHVCEICNKTFRQRASLSVHRRFHLKKILFHCKLCNRGFPRKQDKERHELTHTDLKPYECKVCNKSFRSSASAIRHRQSHNPEIQKHICDACGDCFTQERYLKAHYKKFHVDR